MHKMSGFILYAKEFGFDTHGAPAIQSFSNQGYNSSSYKRCLHFSLIHHYFTCTYWIYSSKTLSQTSIKKSFATIVLISLLTIDSRELIITHPNTARENQLYFLFDPLNRQLIWSIVSIYHLFCLPLRCTIFLTVQSSWTPPDRLYILVIFKRRVSDWR